MTEDKAALKYVGPAFVPGVPARDLTQEDLDGLGEDEMEMLRRDGEREAPAFKHTKTLGHSEQFKEAREREKADKAAAAKKE